MSKKRLFFLVLLLFVSIPLLTLTVIYYAKGQRHIDPKAEGLVYDSWIVQNTSLQVGFACIDGSSQMELHVDYTVPIFNIAHINGIGFVQPGDGLVVDMPCPEVDHPYLIGLVTKVDVDKKKVFFSSADPAPQRIKPFSFIDFILKWFRTMFP